MLSSPVYTHTTTQCHAFFFGCSGSNEKDIKKSRTSGNICTANLLFVLPFPISFHLSFFLSLLVNTFLRLYLASSSLFLFRNSLCIVISSSIHYFHLSQTSLLYSIEIPFALCATYGIAVIIYCDDREWSEVLKIKNYYWKSSPKPLPLCVMSLNIVVVSLKWMCLGGASDFGFR